MSNLKIKHGPFAGNEFEGNEAYTAVNEDGTMRQQILLATATQRFLEKFPPHEGWSVQVVGELLPLEMVPLTGPVPDDGYRVNAQHVPAAKFVATLTNPTGVVVGSASTLWTISGPTAWERGETNARTRLYEAMGLQIRFGEAPLVPEGRRQPATVTALPTPDVRPVLVKRIEEEPVKAPAAIEPSKAVATQAQVQALVPEPAAGGAADQVMPAVETQPEAKAERPQQQGMALGDVDPDTLPPAPQMLQQITRLAKLMGKEVPHLATRKDATAFLSKLQGKG